MLGSPLTHLCLQECGLITSECDSSALLYEIASSGTRCSCCKPVVLVTLGGCHLLNGLVVVFVEARKKLVWCSREELCEGHCARPVGATKSNSSKVRHEGQQVV